jgi:hypothetical protein
VTTWLNARYFDHIEVIVVGALIMFTKTVSIPKGAINGAIATLIAINHGIKYQAERLH